MLFQILFNTSNQMWDKDMIFPYLVDGQVWTLNCYNKKQKKAGEKSLVW